MSASARLPTTRPTESAAPRRDTSDANSPPQKAFSAPMKRRSGSRQSVSRRVSTPPSARRSSPTDCAGSAAASCSRLACAEAPPSSPSSRPVARRTVRRGRTRAAKHTDESAATPESTTNIVENDVARTSAADEKLPAALPAMNAAQKTPDQRPRLASVVHAVSSEPCATQRSPAPQPRTTLPSSCAQRR